MSKANPGPRSEPMLSPALQELSRSAPQSAPPELGQSLAAAFHRHHLRRRIIRRAATLVVSLGIGVGLLWLRLGNPVVPEARQVSIKPSNSVKQSASSENSDAMPQPGRNRIRRTSARTGALHASPKANVAASTPFVALPSFAFRTPQEELRIVRVEMPASSLRLLGAHVNDEIIAGRVTADLLVGPDGTAYAFRLVT
jgi:hypothetical protein